PNRKDNVLFICTANVCRSPLAEQVMRARLPAASAYEPSSAGVLVSAGTAMDPLAAEQSRAFNGDPTGAVSTPLLQESAAGAAVILTMTAAHRHEVVTRFPRAVHTTFLLTEFTDLLTSLSHRGPGIEDVLGPSAQ